MKKEGFLADCKTLNNLLTKRSQISSQANAFLSLNGNGAWQPISWGQYGQNVIKVAAKLRLAGIHKGEYVAILAPTSLNWEYAQMGAISIAAIVAGIDQNYPPDQLNYILRNINFSVLFVQDRETLEKIPYQTREKFKLIIIFVGKPQNPNERSFNEILNVHEPAEYKKEFSGVLPEDAAVMVFSSGTTGTPQAIIFSHEQILTAINAILEVYDDIEVGATLVCWLPLANLFQRVINFCAISRGLTSYIINDPRDLMQYICKANPDILIGVPKVFEKVHAGIMRRIEKKNLIVRCLTHWAMRVGYKQLRTGSSSDLSFSDRFLWVFADKLILRHIRATFGSRIRYLVSGSAPMPLWLLEWFEAVGLPILEAYGVSENIIPISINRLSDRKLGTVGKPLPANEIILSSDNEILVRGFGVFGGYVANNKAAAGFTRDGFWATGDLGKIDSDGFLSLIGRKSEVFKTSGGKWVNPAQIEAQIRRAGYIEDCLVLPLDSGNIVAIICIDNSTFLNVYNQFLSKDQLVNEYSQDINIESLRADLVSILQLFPVYKRPVGVLITTKEFSVLKGELTTNMKLRRQVISSHFAQYIDELEMKISKSRKINEKELQVVMVL